MAPDLDMPQPLVWDLAKNLGGYLHDGDRLPEYRDHFAVRALRRWPLHTSYDDVVADIGELIRSSGLQDAVIALDLTGPGRLAGRSGALALDDARSYVYKN